jgi:hypothetical protein
MLREELGEVEREIGKIDDDLSVAYDHRDFIMYLAPQMTAVSGDKGMGNANLDPQNDPESEFFVTEVQKKEHPSNPGLEDDTGLPMNKQTLLNLLVILEEKYAVLTLNSPTFILNFLL